MHNRPKVGVGVILTKENKILLGKRKNAHGNGSWSFPGGHLEFNETWEDCAKRETLEETGIFIHNIRFASVTNDIFEMENKHYITIFMIAEYKSGDLKIMEPDKCEEWSWFAWDESTLPEPLFIPIQNLLKQQYNPFIDYRAQ